MLEYSAYIHSNGTLHIKRCINGDSIEKDSPFVKKHLGVIKADNLDEARTIFKERMNQSVPNLGREHSNRKDVVNFIDSEEKTKSQMIVWLVKQGNIDDLKRARDILDNLIKGGSK